MVEMVNNQPGQMAMIRPPDPRDAEFNYLSLSCSEGEHERCDVGPEKPMAGRGLRSDDLAPRCICDHHRRSDLGEIVSSSIEIKPLMAVLYQDDGAAIAPAGSEVSVRINDDGTFTVLSKA